MLLEPDQIAHTQSMVAKRGPQANVHTPMYMYVKKSFRTLHSRIQIDPAIMDAIGQHTFLGGLMYGTWKVHH